MATRGEHWLQAQRKLADIERNHPDIDDLGLAVGIAAIHAQLAGAHPRT